MRYPVLLFIVAKHNFWANLTICKICVLIPYECFKEITIIALYCCFVYCLLRLFFTVQGWRKWALGILTIAPPIFNIYKREWNIFPRKTFYYGCIQPQTFKPTSGNAIKKYYNENGVIIYFQWHWTFSVKMYFMI